MTININRRFIIELHRRSVFVRLPFVGQAFIGRGMTSADGGRTLKATGEV